ncbi:holo-ACP synthase [Thalassotalea mangrovi]|uniref:Holo-[acyl-carrier-protein] synthase n=1 Tax=Thalassotalea mangrovi TaxID=2572245 RepID=A0A4U1B6K4_9GAMM|nr:holo-ACP synthase [Thalassotalea mangrovi]TKB46174.1 holo-ACP synthase [Thalassotalea mangrovi]
MSVVGIGNDLIEIARIAKMADKARDRLSKRILTESEMAIYQSHNFPERFLAKRWAAKEAAAKALGTGIAAGVSFQHIEISNLDNGQPQLNFSGRALEIAEQLNAIHFHISLSDEQHYAVAFVVLSK